MKRHSFDAISFLFGVTFAGIGLVFVTTNVDVVDLGWRWVWPVPLIFLGALLLAVALKRRGAERAGEAGS